MAGYSRFRLDISFIVPGMAFNGDSLTKHSLGGSETAALCVARELAARGHYVRMFCNTTSPGIYDGVTYQRPEEWPTYGRSTSLHDVVIGQRAPELFSARLNSRLNILWCHDLALARQAQTFLPHLWNVDKVFVLSRFMKEQYKRVYGLPEEQLYQTRNGLDLETFDQVYETPRNVKRMVYCARPERGLDVLLGSIFPKMLNRDPTLTLAIAGYDNTLPHMVEFYQNCWALAARLGDRVVNLGALTKPDLYSLYKSSGLYLYPTPSPSAAGFSEVSCISAMECAAAGLPIITSARGALLETVLPTYGVLVDGDPWSEEYQNRFIDEAFRLINSPDSHENMSQAGKAYARSLSWSQVAADWEDHFLFWMCQRSDSPTRLALSFTRRTDIMAAKAALENVDTEDAKTFYGTILTRYAFAFGTPEDFAAHYAQGGWDTDARLRSGAPETKSFTNPDDPRVLATAACMDMVIDKPKTVLDYGCGHGWTSIYYANRFGFSLVGIDVDPKAAEWATAFAKDYAKEPHKLKFLAGDHNTDLGELGVVPEGGFDAVLITEVLEHLPRPWEILNAIERWVKPGGKVYITVPYGPWEYNTYNWYKFPNHLWDFDRHDIRDMLGHKTGFNFRPVYLKDHEDLDEPLGFHWVEYIVRGEWKEDNIIYDEPSLSINMTRKLQVQAPRQSLGVFMMAGPEVEDTLRWTLKSVRLIADQIVIADCGMSEAAKTIAAEYGAGLVSSKSPLIDGFEGPRNDGLNAITTDWAMWIDTDEHLTVPSVINKYLRENVYTGYGCRQVHFSVDANFSPDTPIRLFRRRLFGGKMMRFFGKIHEHPEFAMNEGPGRVVIAGDINIAHLGYLAEFGRRKRFDRNLPLLQKDMQVYPERLLQKHFICRDLMLMNYAELRQNGMKMTDTVRTRCEQVITTYRQYFLGKSQLVNVDPKEYYSKACELLGLGINLHYAVVGERDGQSQGEREIKVVRYASIEDAKVDFMSILENRFAPLSSSEW